MAWPKIVSWTATVDLTQVYDEVLARELERPCDDRVYPVLKILGDNLRALPNVNRVDLDLKWMTIDVPDIYTHDLQLYEIKQLYHLAAYDIRRALQPKEH